MLFEYISQQFNGRDSKPIAFLVCKFSYHAANDLFDLRDVSLVFSNALFDGGTNIMY